MTHVYDYHYDYHCPVWMAFAVLAGIGICWMLLMLGIASKDVLNHRLVYWNRIPVVKAHHFEGAFMCPNLILWLIFLFYNFHWLLVA